MMDADDPIIGYGLNAESDPMPPMQQMHTVTEERWGLLDHECGLWPILFNTEAEAIAFRKAAWGATPIRMTLTYTVSEDAK